MTETTQAGFEITPEMLYALLRRAMRNTVILAVAMAVPTWIGSNWRNAAMVAVGAAISAASIWEWLRLAKAINARLDNQRAAANTAVVVVLFLVRLAIFAGVLYGSLKLVQGSGVALLCGLALAVTTLAWEALRLLR